MEYQIIVKLDDQEFEAKIKAENWQEVCDYVFGKIEIIDKNEKEI